MARVRTVIRWVIPGLCAGLFAVPAAASADTDGGTAGPAGRTPSLGPATPAPTGVAGALSVAPSSLLQRQVAVVNGSVPAADAGHAVWLQVEQGAGPWVTVLRASAAANGSFALHWRANRSGQLKLRVVSSDVASASSVTATPEVALAVYQQVVATWYGPGFYGNRTACGEKLTKQIVGIADRTLPCGTPVSLSYGGRTLTLPVIDRGPFANGATIDLTHAAAQELGITETVSVAMLALSGPPLAPSNWFAPGGAPTGSTGTTGATGSAGTTVAGGATAPSA
jgi:rare lipoprotein A